MLAVSRLLVTSQVVFFFSSSSILVQATILSVFYSYMYMLSVLAEVLQRNFMLI